MMLNDYIHLIGVHSDDALYIQEEMNTKYKLKRCSVKHCKLDRRARGGKRRNNDFYSATMCSAHFFLSHLRESGLRTMRTNKEQKQQEQNEDDTDCKDLEFVDKMKEIRKSKKECGLELGSTTKFTIIIGAEDEQKGIIYIWRMHCMLYTLCTVYRLKEHIHGRRQ